MKEEIETMKGIVTALSGVNSSEKSENLMKMKSKASAFETTYEDYYGDIKNDEDITSETTQPYWQSLHLSKQKLKKNNLQMHIHLAEEKSKSRMENTYYHNDGKNQFATFKHPLIVHKSFTRDGKVLYNKKEKKIGLIHVIKSSTDGDKVACPNCGHMGTVTSYIDGCDYCNSKFEVSEFQEMISSMNIEDDVKQKTKNMYKKALLTSLSIIGIGVISFILSLIYIIYCGIIKAEAKQSMAASLIFLCSMKMIPVVVVLTIILAVAFVIVCAYLFNKTYRRVENSPALNDFKRYDKDFSPEKFAEELEYKLRNIHFAENVEEVSAFANIDLSDVISNYDDVIECNLQRIKFLDFKDKQDYYAIQVMTVLKNYRINGDIIKPSTEQVILNLSCKKEVLNNNTSMIKMHRCSQCGSSVSLLNGGICTYCNAKLDYSLYGFMIEGYYSNVSENDIQGSTQTIEFGKHKYKDTTFALRRNLTIFLIMAVVISGAILYKKCGKWFYMQINYDSYVEHMLQVNKEIETIDSICPGLEIISSKEDSFDRYYQYKPSYGSSYDYNEAVHTYGAYLENHGYELYLDNNDILIYSKKIVFDSHLTGYNFIKMYYGTNNEIKVYYEMNEESFLEHDDIYPD